jgi:hypothetical protein
MAQMTESAIVVKVSKLIKDGEVVTEIINDDVVAQLEDVIRELVNDERALIEVIKA